MKRAPLKITLFVLTGVQIIPAQAMWTSAARAALRSGQFNASTRLAPAAIAGSNLLHSQPGSRLPARTLASTHDQDYRGYNRNGQHARSDSNSSESNGYSWRSFFSQADKAQILGGTILGWHLWWSDDDICQKPEDFLDTKKWERTQKYFHAYPDYVAQKLYDQFDNYKNDDHAIRLMAQFAQDNFAAFTRGYRPAVIVKIMENQPSAVASFVQPVLDNFDALAQCPWGCVLISKILKAQPSATPSFVQPALDNFAALAQCPWGCELVYTLIEAQPSAAPSFVQPALENFAALAKIEWGCALVYILIEAQPSAAPSFVQPTLKNFAALPKNPLKGELIYKILKTQPSAAPSFEASAKAHCDEDVLGVIEILKIKKSMAELLQSAAPTQTTQHALGLLNHNLSKIEKFFPKNKAIHTFKDMVREIIATELKEQNSGNYTFVHAYPWNIRFLQDIDAQLRSIVYDTPAQSLSVRFIKAPHEATGKKPQTIRRNLLTNGPDRYYARDGNKQKHMIFMNYALLTNQIGSNTLQYIANDRCENPPKLLLDKIFKHLDLEQYHTKYQQEIEELQTLHREASMFGAGILFSFTPEMLQKSVYVCYGGGKKRKVYINGIGQTDNVKVILDTLRTAPKKIKDLDRLEFVFVVTKDCALNLRVQKAAAYKVIPFNAADPEKMALYEQKRDELMAKIKADIEAERAAQTAEEKAQHEKKIAAMMTWYASHSCLEGCKESRVIS